MLYRGAKSILTQTVNGQTTSFVYDVMRRQTKVTAPGGVVTNTTYYPTGDIRRVDGATYPVEYTYNALGKQATMKTFKDADTPQVTSWTYNARGEMVQKTYADGNSINYTYNADGQLLTRTRARGIVTTYTYDNAGRATGYSYSDGVTPAVVITFDFLDRQNSITDAAGMRSFSYNANNQLGNETNPSIMNGMITYTYDNAGRRTGMNLSNGTTSLAQANYVYDTRGRIATVGNNTDTLTYTYIPGTNMVGSSAWQNASINTVNTYDQYKRLTNIAVNGSNVYGYTLNDKNQRTSATLPDGNKWNYTYDVMGQLTGAVKQDTANNPLANMNYFYDLIGNRTSATENSATTTYTSNIVNQYTAVNAIVPVYDLDGNMTSYNGWTYTYNGENRLIVAENAAAGVRIEADYDYMGRRLFKKVYNNNTLTKHSVFVYDGFKQIAEFDVLNNNSLKASYLWQPVGLDVVLLRNDEYFIADGNKNIIQVRNATGSVTDSYVYDPFGKVAHNGSSENTFQFSSEIFDNETGLVYYNYRYYMPELGRWLRFDPLEEAGGANIYIMLNNDGINLLDEAGLWVKVKPQDPNDFTYCAQKGDTLSKLAKNITGNGQDYVCLWPVSVKYPNRYPDFVSIKDKYNAENLEKKWDVKLLLRFSQTTPYEPAEMITKPIVLDRIKKTSGEGATPISYMMLDGHGNENGIYDDKSNTMFSMAMYSQSIQPSYERAKAKKGPQRCWFSRDASVRFSACSTARLANNFARRALRKGAMAYGTKYTIWYKNNGIGYEVTKNKELFSQDKNTSVVWSSYSGGL